MFSTKLLKWFSKARRNLPWRVEPRDREPVRDAPRYAAGTTRLIATHIASTEA